MFFMLIDLLINVAASSALLSLVAKAIRPIDRDAVGSREPGCEHLGYGLFGVDFTSQE